MNVITDVTRYAAMPGLFGGTRRAILIIVRGVSIMSGVLPESMIGPGRVARVARARHVAMWLIRECTDLSFQEIGNLFGRRHHAAVMHACKNVAVWMEKDERLSSAIVEIRQAAIRRDPVHPFFLQSRI